MELLITIGIIVALFFFFLIFVKSCWKVAGTNEVLIVSGLGKLRRKQVAVFLFFLLSRRHRE